MRVWYRIDGSLIATTADFYRVVGEAVNGDGGYFGTNLDAFRDCLSGGFGTPDDGDFAFVWTYSDRARVALGHPETARLLDDALERCHPSNRERIARERAAARRGDGPTVFDRLVDIFADRHVELRLE